jgi:DNA polymerase I-like protein with 3'-5' exonuclease and polymerase domains
MRHLATEQGYVETLAGRRRYFPGLKNQRNFNIRNREEREAINAPIQGTAADIMKIAMVNVPVAIAEAGLSARMLMQVHDELVLECPRRGKQNRRPRTEGHGRRLFIKDPAENRSTYRPKLGRNAPPDLDFI